MKLEHRHINTFYHDNLKDKGRNNVLVSNFEIDNSHIENVICEVFDETIQRHVEVTVHWHFIMDFMERRQPLGLSPATVKAVVWYNGIRSYAKSWSKWNKQRKTWELTRIGVGAYGYPICLKFEEET